MPTPVSNIGLNEEKRLTAMEGILGQGKMLETEKIKEKVREAQKYKSINLSITGDKLLVRSGGGF